MKTYRLLSIVLAATTTMLAALYARAQNKPAAPEIEQERRVTEKEVPAAALATLKKMAGNARITEFTEEIEHGHTFYEASWMGPDGKVDCLVTPSGDLVEIEERIPVDKAPASVRASAERESGGVGKMYFEKKTMILYEIHFKKDGRYREMVFTPDARRYYEHGPIVKGGGEDEDADEEDERD